VSPLRPIRILFHCLQLVLLSLGIWITASQIFAQEPAWEFAKTLTSSKSSNGFEKFAFDILSASNDFLPLRESLSLGHPSCQSPEHKKAWSAGVDDALSGEKPTTYLNVIEQSAGRPCQEYRQKPGAILQASKSQDFGCCMKSHSLVMKEFSKIIRAIPANPEDKFVRECRNNVIAAAVYVNEICGNGERESSNEARFNFSIFPNAWAAPPKGETCAPPQNPENVGFASCFMEGFNRSLAGNKKCFEELMGRMLPQSAIPSVSSQGTSPSAAKDSGQEGSTGKGAGSSKGVEGQ